MDSNLKETKSAGGVVMNNKGQILIVSQNGDSWSLPKGHIDEGEDDITAAKREVYEESGIDQLELIGKLGNYQRSRIGKNGKGEDKSEIKTIIMFLFRTNMNLLKPIDVANPEARWVEKGEILRLLTHPKDREFFLGIIQQL